ncbi:hypothetical protein CAPN004_09160 [Capnocytophaga cynodegmi]|uniref:DUF3800 domain-containing protein n=1 Tax=Capnocytophaga cynodegmi TaxID=28189 RepID=UPI001AD572F1|nr:DUF3800 domain-containing protein [Capnocytophaga cynodegmi]GIM51886.1 hypothetical protein CAPN004_09160 [Capnocytophaga cynodegmi]
MKGFYIFCDESLKRGKYYSNFYGGLLINKEDFQKVNNILLSKIQDLNMEKAEIKWSSVTPFVLENYKHIMEVFFMLIKEGTIKVRIMFSDNRIIPQNLSKEHYENEYHILYYHFLKYAFGLKYLYSDYPLSLEIFFDKLPDTEKKNKKFKRFIYGLQFLPMFENTQIEIREDGIHEIDSKKYILLQCLDVVLGAMAFRLNDMHREIPAGKKRRGKRTIAKDTLYKYINSRIRNIRPNFNIGISTGIDGNYDNRFFHPYRHWLFVPSSSNKNFGID